MSADMTTRERQEATRFGMFDAEILAEMEEHADDTLPCDARTCEREADVLLRRTCCPRRNYACTGHYAGHRKEIEVELKIPRKHRCTGCGFRHPANARFEDIYRVVPL